MHMHITNAHLHEPGREMKLTISFTAAETEKHTAELIHMYYTHGTGTPELMGALSVFLDKLHKERTNG